MAIETVLASIEIICQRGYELTDKAKDFKHYHRKKKRVGASPALLAAKLKLLKPIIRTDVEGVEVRFTCAEEAARKTLCSKTCVRKSARTGKIGVGYYWRYAE